MKIMTTYYVAKNGNDSNPGTEASPWLTLTKTGNTAKAGDTVYIKEGTYNERLYPVNSGTPGNYIKFIGKNAIIDNRMLSGGRSECSIRLIHLDWIWIEGFTIYPSINIRCIWMGIDDFVSGETKFSSNLRIKGNHIIANARPHNLIHVGHYGGGGMEEGKNTDIIIEENTLTLSGTELEFPSNNAEMISLSYTNRCEVRYNQIYGSFGIGMCFKGGYTNLKIHHNIVEKSANQAIYLDGYARYGANVEIYNNYLKDVGPFRTPYYLIPQPIITLGAEWGQSATIPHLKENVKIYNNILINADVGVNIGGGQNSPTIATFQNIHVYNNTIINMTGYGIQAPTWGINPPILKDIVIRNNLLYGGKKGTDDVIYHKNVLGITIENNHYSSGTSRDPGIFPTYGNPLFVSITDYHLRKESPCVDTGTSNGAPLFDYDNKPRIGNPDRGAHEYTTCNVSKCNFTITQ